MGRAPKDKDAPKKVGVAGYLLPEDYAELEAAAARFDVPKQLIISEGTRRYLARLRKTGKIEVYPGPISELPEL